MDVDTSVEINYAAHVLRMLAIARRTYGECKLGKEQDGQVNSKGDTSLRMDMTIHHALLKYAMDNQLPVKVYSEEAKGWLDLVEHPTHVLAFDPLDGSMNYKNSHTDFPMPHGTLIAFYAGDQPTVGDVVASGVIEFTSGVEFVYDGNVTRRTDRLPIDEASATHAPHEPTWIPDWEVGKTTPVYLDLYYPAGMQEYLAFADQFFIRGSGSVVGNLIHVLLGGAAFMGGISVRAEEVGAVYGLIHGAGGIVVNHKGRDLSGSDLKADGKYQVLAGSESAVRAAGTLMHRRER